MPVIASGPVPVRHFSRLLALCAVALLACRCLLALALIPPWQQPDEPTHIAHVELQRARADLRDGLPDPAREADILESMARYDWWNHRRIGLDPPEALPRNFYEFALAGNRGLVEVVHIPNPPVYFKILAHVFRQAPSQPAGTDLLVMDLYASRMVSVVFALLTLVIAGLAARECLGTAGGAAVMFLLALHPQFAILSTAASPDPAANFFAACLWWQVALLMTERRGLLLPLAGMWAAAIAASATDRMGVPLVGLALIVSLLVAARRLLKRGRPSGRVVTIAAVLVLGMAGTAIWAIAAFGQTYAINYILSRGLTPVPGILTWSHFLRFNWLLHESWWFTLGWGRYTPPGWWIGIATAVSLAAATGLVRRLYKGPLPNRQTLTFLALGVTGIAIQLAAIYWTYFRLGNGAQGRYLFPLLVPSLVLLWTGIEAWVPPARRVHAACALVLLVGLLDASAWMLVAVPAYYGTF